MKRHSFYSPRMRPHPRVVIVGAGFGGLQCAKALRDQPVDVVLVDKQNYHLFTPLLYQVASCLLAPAVKTATCRTSGSATSSASLARPRPGRA